ncbi:hypothetical protein Bbelb_135990 [Branchiostoma belcheri]|nr:hypothetical protein Bbelb_135990 [Branchiostoma belcheri]
MSSVGFHRNNGRRNFKIFYNKKRPEIARKYPFLGAKQIQRKVEALWRSLGPAEREEFCIVQSPSVADNFSQSEQAWQDEEPFTPSFRTVEWERPSDGSDHEIASTTAPDADVTWMSGDEEEQQHEEDVQHSVTHTPLVRTTTWEKKPHSHVQSDETYLPKTAGDRSQSSTRSKGLLTLHMARMQMVATTSKGIGKGEFTRSSNSESEDILCSEDWFDQEAVTEQTTENKHSHAGNDTESEQNRQDKSLSEEPTEFVKKDGCFKFVPEAGDQKDEYNMETNEDTQYTLTEETRRAITQYLSGNGLNSTFNTSNSEDEQEDGETKILIESAIDSLETELSGDNESIGTAVKGPGKGTSSYDRISSILSEIIHEVAQNADPHTATYGKGVKHGQQAGKENMKGYEYDSGDNRSKSDQVMDHHGIPITSDEARDSGSELWDRMFRSGTPLKSRRTYRRKRSSSFSESEGAWEVETSVEMLLTGHSDRQQKKYRDMDHTYAMVHSPYSTGDVNTSRPEQSATQDSAPTTKQRECYNTVTEELRTMKDTGIAASTSSSVMGGKESEVNVEEDKRCIIDEALSGMLNAHQVTQSTPSHWQQQPATSNVLHQITQEGKHSMEQPTGSNHLDLLHLKSSPMDVPTESEQQVEKQITRNSSSGERDSTKAKRRGMKRPAKNNMARLLRRDYNITTRAQAEAGKRNTRSKVLDYRRLSGMKDKQQKTPSRRNWQRSSSKDSILSCDSGQSLRTPRPRGKKRKRHLSTSSVGSDFSTTSSVPEVQEDHQWEDVPNEESEMTNDQSKEKIDNSETRANNGSDVWDRITSANVSPFPSMPPVDNAEQIEEKGVQNSQETKTPQSKKTDDPNRQLEKQDDDPWNTHTEETEQDGDLKPENCTNHETAPSSSGGFLCEMFSDPKPHTGAWLPGFNRKKYHTNNQPSLAGLFLTVMQQLPAS